MFFGHNLSRSSTPVVLSSGVAAGDGDTQNSAALDMGLGRGAVVSVILGTVSTGGTGTIKLQMSQDNGVSDPYVDIAGSGFSYTIANTLQVFDIDVFNPQKRYIRATVIRAGAGNTVIAAILARVYQLAKAPETPGTTVGNVTWLSNPGPGVA